MYLYLCLFLYFILIPMVVVTVYLAFLEIKNKKINKYYMFLDDERELPKNIPSEQKWIVCRSSEEAKQTVLNHGLPLFISFDHDLGGNDTSMNFVKWLAEEYFNMPNKNPGGNYLKIPGYIIHSQNPIGSKNIQSYMESWKKIYESR